MRVEGEGSLGSEEEGGSGGRGGKGGVERGPQAKVKGFLQLLL